jgi:hypothetical protein
MEKHDAAEEKLGGWEEAFIATEGLSDASDVEAVLLSRAFLEGCLEERLSQEDPLVLDSRQREFLELVASSATFRGVIAVPKDLLEAFFRDDGVVALSRAGSRGKRQRPRY